jgi:hypothetical protein
MESAVGIQWAYSDKRQSAYPIPNPPADIDQSHPFEGTDIGDHAVNMVDNAALYGKGHEFATREYLLSWDTRFRRQCFLTSKIAGWGFAFHTGKVTTLPLGGTAFQHVMEYQDPNGAGYYGSGRQLPVTTIIERVTSGMVRRFPSMLVSAIELSGSMNDFCRCAMDLVGSGAMNRLPMSGAVGGSAIIGSGANGTVTVTDDVVGDSAKTIEVVVAPGASAALGAAITGDAITVTLGTTAVAGTPDPTKNTATLVAAAVHALAGVTAVASGTGITPLTNAEPPKGFAGGGTAFVFPTGEDANEGERLRNTAMLFEVGPEGEAVPPENSCDVRSWRFRSEYALAEADGYCPGSGYFIPGNPLSGQIRNKLEFLRRAVLLEWVVRASSDNTIFTQLEGLVNLSAKITLTGAAIAGSAFHEVVIDVPAINYRAIPIGVDGDLITYSVQTVIRWSDDLQNPYEVSINNDTPEYLVASV